MFVAIYSQTLSKIPWFFLKLNNQKKKIFKNEINHSEMTDSQLILRLTTKTAIFPKFRNRSSERKSKFLFFEKRDFEK